MLVSLDIRDILIIDRLTLEFQPGLNVLTGETGAGKSILLDALGAVLGWRGRGDIVRAGAAKGVVTAVFHVPHKHPSLEVLNASGVDVEAGEIILSRSLTPDGRRLARVNDRPASATLLKSLGETLVELHGQHDDRGLLDPRGHRRLLDSFAGVDDELTAIRVAWKARLQALETLAEAEHALKALAGEEDFLRHAVEELQELDPRSGEADELDKKRRHMQGAEKVRKDIGRAAQALSGPEAADSRMNDAMRWLEDAAGKLDTGLGPAIEMLSRAIIELDEAADAVASVLDGLDYDPLVLERTEERLFAIRALARKHGVPPDGLMELSEQLSSRLERLDRSGEDIEALRREVKRAESAYEHAATILSNARKAGAARLDTAMANELAPLKLDRAVFSTQIDTATAGAEGSDSVIFTVATNPGAPAGALNKIASGGELSRFLLALKVCLAAGDDPKTMIFDEIDRGVGGATASAVGKRLATLAAAGQVLVVTHSPQVAAAGGHHWRVEKRIEGEMTLSTVKPLDAEARESEIARMLSGDTVTQAARAAARSLLGHS